MAIDTVCLGRGRHQPVGGVPGPVAVGHASLVDARAQGPRQRRVVGEALGAAIWPAHFAQPLHGVVRESRAGTLVIDRGADQIGGLTLGVDQIVQAKLAAGCIADGQKPIRPGGHAARGGGVAVGQPQTASAVRIHHMHQHACGREVVGSLCPRIPMAPGCSTASHEDQSVGLIPSRQHLASVSRTAEGQAATACHAVESGMARACRDARVKVMRPKRAEWHGAGTVGNPQPD